VPADDSQQRAIMPRIGNVNGNGNDRWRCYSHLYTSSHPNPNTFRPSTAEKIKRGEDPRSAAQAHAATGIIGGNLARMHRAGCGARRVASLANGRGGQALKNPRGVLAGRILLLPVLTSLTSPFPPLALAIAIFNAKGNGKGAHRCSPNNIFLRSSSALHCSCCTCGSHSNQDTRNHNTPRRQSTRLVHFRQCMMHHRMRAAARRAASAPAPSPPEPPTTGWLSGAQELPHAKAASLQGFSQ
jgi:hypothetical protein